MLIFYNEPIFSASVNSSNCYPNGLLLFFVFETAPNLTQLSLCFCCFHILFIYARRLLNTQHSINNSLYTCYCFVFFYPYFSFVPIAKYIQ